MQLLSTKLALFINGIIEVLGGIAVLFYPQVLIWGGSLNTELVAATKLYGLAAITIGLMSVLLAQSIELTAGSPLEKAILLFAGFHILISFQLYSYYNIEVITHPGPFMFHLILGGYLTMVYLYNKPAAS